MAKVNISVESVVDMQPVRFSRLAIAIDCSMSEGQMLDALRSFLENMNRCVGPTAPTNKDEDANVKPDTPTKTELHQRIENLEREVAAQRQAANEHRNAAMEADLRTQAAVRGEKKALAEKVNLSELRRVMIEWHQRAVDLGFDGVPDLVASIEAGRPTNTKLWTLLIPAPIKPTTLCWRCNTAYPMADMQCQSCGATNANRDPETAAAEVRAKKFDRGGQREHSDGQGH